MSMLMPDKYIPLSATYLGLGAFVLKSLGRPQTVDALWKRLRDNPNFVTYERFLYALDFLFMLRLVDLSPDGSIVRRSHAAQS